MRVAKKIEVEEGEAERRGPRGSPLWKGMGKGTFSLTSDQLKALRAEALRRAAEAGSGRPDASALVREALDAWLAKNAPKR
jgi:hypothetical protein